MKRVVRRDLVVVGASAGGVEALSRLVATLPADFAAAMVIVLHVAPTARSHMPAILSRAGVLPAVEAEHGAKLEHGHIYVAPPDRHVLVRDGKLVLSRGPRENRHRPAVDPLFRSAALARGAGVIGVVLTGALDDGTVGLKCVRARGGLAVVQDPADATVPSMPESALRIVGADHVLPLHEIGPALTRLVRAPITTKEPKKPEEPDEARTPSGFACPECHGALWEVEGRGMVTYECRIGHKYSPSALVEDDAQALEAALWAAVRALRESAAVDRRLGELTASGKAIGLRAEYAANARAKDVQADRIEGMLLDIDGDVARPGGP